VCGYSHIHLYDSKPIILDEFVSRCLALKVDKMKGMKVITADAFALGEVGGAVADPKTWQITHLDLELSKEAIKEFAFKKPMLGSLSVCLPVTAVNQVGDVIILNQSLAEFKNLPECKPE